MLLSYSFSIYLMIKVPDLSESMEEFHDTSHDIIIVKASL